MALSRCRWNPPRPAADYLARFEAGEPPSVGCFDITLHQTALYDFVSTFLLLGLLLYVGRKVRKPGFLAITYVLWYGTVRFIVDFLRNDRRYLGLTGSQLWAAIIVIVCAYLLIRYRGAPPKWQKAPLPPEKIEEVPLEVAEGDRPTGQTPPIDHST